MAEQQMGGVYVANVTPFKDDGTLAVEDGAYIEHVTWLSEEGVRGVVPFGTNGEGPSVSLEEKLRVLGVLFRCETRLQVIPSVMQGNLPDTLRMIEFLNVHPASISFRSGLTLTLTPTRPAARVTPRTRYPWTERENGVYRRVFGARR